MATFPTPSQLFAQYKTFLKNLRPDLNTEDKSSDVIIRGKVLSGVLSGLYGDQKSVDDDTFVQDARLEALTRKAADYGMSRQPATSAESGNVKFTGTVGAVVPVGTTVRYITTGILYTLQAAVTIGALGEGSGAIVCNVTGQIGNVAVGGQLKLDTPPTGIDTTVVLVEALASGSDIETVDSFRTRLLTKLQRTPSGGNQYDYPTFAFSADASVRSALIRRFGRGLGTVDVYITTGTTDVDTAIDQGQAIVRIPGQAVIDTVQAYYDANAPLTDCVLVATPTELAIPVIVKVVLYAGLTMSSVPSDSTYNPLNLTVHDLIVREVSRVLYKLPVGGRKIGGSTGGYVVASDIETQLDVMLSGVIDPVSGLFMGKIPVLADRQVQPLDGTNINKALAANQLAAPGTTTIIEGV